jgi:hypothetical protein
MRADLGQRLADARRTIAVAVPTAPRVINAPPTGSCHEEASFVPAFTAAGIGPGVRVGAVDCVVRCWAPVFATCVVVGREPVATGGVDVRGTVFVGSECVGVVRVDVGWGGVLVRGGVTVVVFVLVVVLVLVGYDVLVSGTVVEVFVLVGYDVLVSGTVVEVFVLVSVIVVAVTVDVVLLEPRSADAGRAAAITRTAPAVTVAPPAARLQRGPRGDVGAVGRMLPPLSGRQLTCRTAWPVAGCRVDQGIRPDPGAQLKRWTRGIPNYDRGGPATHER